jgi:hypothetical protein
MMLLVRLLEWLACLGCRHQWVRERRENGRLGLRCMKCMKRKEHNMLKLIEWQLDYQPIEPAYPSQLPPQLPHAVDGTRLTKKGKRVA